MFSHEHFRFVIVFQLRVFIGWKRKRRNCTPPRPKYKTVSPNFLLLLKIESPTGPSPVDIINQRRFLLNKKFRFLQVSEILGAPKGTVDYNPIQSTARLVIVLVSRIQKSGTGYNNLANGKEPSRTDQTGPSSMVLPNIPIGLNRNDSFHLISTRSFRNFRLNEWKAPKSPLWWFMITHHWIIC